MQKRLSRPGLGYLDAAIFGTPTATRHGRASVFISGQLDDFRRAEPVLSVLGETSFVGEDIGSALLLDSAILNAWYGATISFIHSASLCRQSGIDANQIVPYLQQALAFTYSWCLSEQDPEALVECTLDVHATAIGNIARLADELGVNSMLPDALRSVVAEAAEHGLAEADLPALLEHFRRP